MKISELLLMLNDLDDKDEDIYIRTRIETESCAGVTNITTELCVTHKDKQDNMFVITILSETY